LFFFIISAKIVFFFCMLPFVESSN